MRGAAALALAEVLRQGRSLSSVLPGWQARVPARDRALLQELCYGVLRWQRRLAAISDSLMDKPLKAKESDVAALILVGLYQLIYLRVPDHAAVSGTVAAIKTLKNKGWAKGLVNGVLRSFQRQQSELPARVDRDEGVALAYPQWLLERLQTAYPDQWRQVAAAGNEHPPMTLRINRHRSDRAQYLAQLQAQQIEAQLCRYSSDGIVLNQPAEVTALPGFDEGWVSVQDEAAQLAAQLLEPQPGERVLDACAAPGGKTAHLLEWCGGQCEMTAVDSEADRLVRLHETLKRLAYPARVLTADVANPGQWWDGKPFDRILVDAPCSATGVIRRHPDIKWLRRDGDIAALVESQRRILEALWPLLKPGGTLLYATCSILPQENDGQLAAFLNRTATATELKIEAEWGEAREVGRQIVPGQAGMDGFYYARIIKR